MAKRDCGIYTENKQPCCIRNTVPQYSNQRLSTPGPARQELTHETSTGSLPLLPSPLSMTMSCVGLWHKGRNVSTALSAFASAKEHARASTSDSTLHRLPVHMVALYYPLK